MQLVGLLDSPYVRRVAVSLQLLGLPFEHRPVSVFRGVDTFRRINPVIKAPTLVCDDGAVLMDSTLILDHAEALAAPRSLMPADVTARREALRLLGLALAGCEKAVQIIYERALRPAEKVHQPWVLRVREQMHAAFDALEADLRRRPQPLAPGAITQAGLSIAVVWHFVQQALPEEVDPTRHHALGAHAGAAELLPAFRAAPHGESAYPVAAG